MQAARTRYQGPVVESAVAVAGRFVRVVRPADPDRLLDQGDVLAWNAADDYMPYWAYLWPGAFLLAEAVGREPGLGEGREALEIGCGLGLAGLVGLACGLRVQFTDYDATALEFVARSAAANGFAPNRFSTRRLDWRALPDERFPIILGADVLYERRLVPWVVHLLTRMLAPGGTALLAGPDRVATEDLAPALDAAGLAWAAEPASAVDLAQESVRGTLYRITRPT